MYKVEELSTSAETWDGLKSKDSNIRHFLLSLEYRAGNGSTILLVEEELEKEIYVQHVWIMFVNLYKEIKFDFLCPKTANINHWFKAEFLSNKTRLIGIFQKV